MSLTYGFCLDELASMYDSAQFSEAFHAVAGDGITQSGSMLSVNINGFSATVGTGYALAAGRWLSNDDPLVLIVQPSGNNDDRTDALAVRVNYKTRKAALELIADADVDKLPNSLRSDDEYSIILYLIRVPRGATTLTPENVTDLRMDPNLCGTVVPLSAISEDVLYIDRFLTSGIDEKVERILSLCKAVVDKADAAILALDSAIRKAGGGAQVGELQIVRSPPDSGWLLCDGGLVPSEYPVLAGLIGNNLPDISRPYDRYRTYIFAGSPKEAR